MKTKAQQEKKNVIKEEIISLVAHQLFNQLTDLRWRIELFSDETNKLLDKQQKSRLAEIYSSSKRVIKFVNEVLNVERIENGRLKVEPEGIELDAVVKDTIKELKAASQKNKVTVTFRKATKKPSKILGDPALIHQVVYNVINNAIKYSAKKNGKVFVTLGMDASSHIISVKDNGIGIPKKEQKKIFSRFFRASNADPHIALGSGLGLYIAKSIMQLANGKIWFDSEENKGSTFYIKFPKKMKKKKGEVSLS